MLYRQLLRPLLFSLARGDPERAHERTLAVLAALSNLPVLLRLIHRVSAVAGPGLARTVFGVRFPNPVGLAAGMDKDGVALPAWAALGFGFVEVGTVTWYAQPGNQRPRVFRLPADQALINRMGFNNHGAAALADRLAELPPLPIPLGISLGKSRVTPVEQAATDYCASLRALYDYAAYIAINVSSPNTPGLRALQDRDQLDALLAAIQRENFAQARWQPVDPAQGQEIGRQETGDQGEEGAYGPDTHDAPRTTSAPRPLLVKIAPDLSEQAMVDLLAVCADHQVSGVIATNTTMARTGLRSPSGLSAETGGLSGRPLAEQSLRIVRFISRETAGRLPIIGVGGILSADDARRMLDAGASLVQLYTGLIYQGPGLVRAINRALRLG